MKLKGVFIAAALVAPTAALAAPGVVTASVGMRAGPGSGFPMVERIPTGSHVNIHGCLQGDAWCDVSWSGDRGWVSSQYLEYLYHDRYVYLPDYVDVVDVPVVPFVLSSYWGSYYSGRPWYHRHAYWNRYWQSHARLATQMPPGARHAGRVGRIETRPGIAQGTPRPQAFAHVHGPQAVQGRLAGRAGGNWQGHWQGRQHLQGHPQGNVQANAPANMHGRFAHVNGPGRPMPAVQQPIARAHAMPHVSAAPMARPATPHMAQPNMGRSGGPPMNAHAQMGGGMRAAPAVPQMGGGAPHANAGPRPAGPTGGGGPVHPHR